MKTTDQIRVFIVDDNVMLTTALRKDIEQTFAARNIVVNTFKTGEDCLKFIDQKPHLVIVDYNMNSESREAMNGLSVIEQIKKESPDTEVIMFTGEAEKEIAAKAFDGGAYSFVVKNEFMFNQIRLSIHQCIRVIELKKQKERHKSSASAILVLVQVVIGAVVVWNVWG